MNFTFCSNDDAEKFAIHQALLQINSYFDIDPKKRTGIVIFSDSLSIINQLETGIGSPREINEIK